MRIENAPRTSFSHVEGEFGLLRHFSATRNIDIDPNLIRLDFKTLLGFSGKPLLDQKIMN